MMTRPLEQRRRGHVHVAVGGIALVELRDDGVAEETRALLQTERRRERGVVLGPGRQGERLRDAIALQLQLFPRDLEVAARNFDPQGRLGSDARALLQVESE